MHRLDGRTIIAVFGFGCLLALSALTLWNALALLPASLAESSPFFYRSVNLGFSLSYPLAAFGYLSKPQRFPQIVFGSAVALLVAGFLLSGYSLGAVFSLPETVLSCGALCIGLGSGFGMVCWMIVFSSFSLKKACVIIVAGSVFAALPTLTVFFIVLQDMSAFITLVFVLLLMSLLSLVLSMHEKLISDTPCNDSSDLKDSTAKESHSFGAVLRNRSTSPEQTDDTSDTKGIRVAANQKETETGALKNQDSKKLPGLFRVILKGFGLSIPCIIVLALFQPLLDAVGLSERMSTLSKTLVTQIANVVGALSILVIWKLSNWEVDISRIFIWITPVFATACLFFPFISESYWSIFSFISMAFFTLLSITVMVSCLQFAKMHHLNIVVVYGLMACFLYIPGFAGSILGSFAGQLGISTHYALFASALIVALCCIALAVWTWRKALATKKTPTYRVLENGKAVSSAYDRVDTTSRLIAVEAALSVREAEILSLLAHGRDVPFIAETLSLSPHTVRGYVKNIYQVLDVHSMRELLDLVDSKSS